MPSETRLYRVFPWVENTPPHEPGHPLYVHTPQGAGRVDNPEHYSVLYASDSPQGAIGEAFGNFDVWRAGLLEGPPSLPGSKRAVATYRAGVVDVLDLDDPRSLLDRDLKPSRVVTRDRSTTQAWALRIHQEGKKWAGVRWWSFHNPEWGSHGIWSHEELDVEEVRPLGSDMALVLEAAAILNRIWRE